MIKMKRYQKIGLIAGIMLFLLILLLPCPASLNEYGKRCLAIAALMFIWWGTEAINFGATGALPIILFPVLGITSAVDLDAYSQYSSATAILVGSMLVVSSAIVKWNLHKRISLKIASLAGGKPTSIIFGFALGTGIVSMFISNTTATTMMLPIALALIASLQLRTDSQFGKALILSIPWAAGVGGIGTLLGGATNMTGVGLIKDMVGFDFTFAEWLKVGVPFVAVLLPVLAFYLVYVFHVNKEEHMKSDTIRQQYEALGPISKGEKMVIIVFIAILVALITRVWWKSYLPFIKDENITMIGCLLMMVIPVDWKNGEMLLDAETAMKGFSLPTVLLIGGSLTLGNAMSTCGVTDWIVLPLLIVAALLTAVVTEFCTNMVVVAAFLPIMYSISIARDINPLILMVAVTASASLAFALPSGTPPTAIAMASGKVDLRDMVKYGFGFKVISILVFVVIFYGITMRLL